LLQILGTLGALDLLKALEGVTDRWG